MDGWGYYDERFDEYMKKLVWGINYGGGMEYIFKQFGIALTFTHQYDFSYAFEGGYIYGGGVTSIKNNAFVLDLGLKYYF